MKKTNNTTNTNNVKNAKKGTQNCGSKAKKNDVQDCD